MAHGSAQVLRRNGSAINRRLRVGLETEMLIRFTHFSQRRTHNMKRRETGLAGGMWMMAVVLAFFAAFIGCGGGGGDSAPVVTVPGAPSSVTVNAGDNSVTVDWSPVAGATSYNIYHGTAPGVTKATGTKVSGVQNPNVVSGLTNGTPYYFVVTAVNSAGESGISAEKTATPSATPPPLAPGNVRASAGDGQATISWDAVSGATSYNIYVGTSTGVTKTNGNKASGVSSPSVVTPLVNGTKYYFVVTAVGAGGESAESFEVSATPAATPPPAAPGGVSAVPGNAQATVSWSPVTGATSYNLYWATASGVTKATGTKIAGVTSPKDVTSLTNGTKYYFVVTAVGAGGESAESAEVYATPIAPPAAFSQADLTGTWDLIQFQTSSQALGGGWMRVVGRFDGSGHLIVDDNTTFRSTAAGDFVPNGDTGMVWTVGSAGVITETGEPTTSAFHGTMASNKHLIIATLNLGSTDKGIRVLRKRTGTTFSNADLVNISFVSHSLFSGTNNTWEWDVGTTDSSRNITLSSFTDPSGTGGPISNIGVISVNSDGIVTFSSDPSFYGFMTDDKKVFFSVNTADVGIYSFMVSQLTGQTYTQSDLAGTYNFNSIRNSPPSWSYGTYSVNATGTLTYLTYTDSAGGATPANSSRVLSASGVVTDPADVTYHGQLSYNKDISVRTNTSAGRYGLAIGFK